MGLTYLFIVTLFIVDYKKEVVNRKRLKLYALYLMMRVLS